VLTWNQVTDQVRQSTGDGKTSLDLDAHLMGPMHPLLTTQYPNAPTRFDMNWKYSHTMGTTADANCQSDYGMPLSDLNYYVEQDIDSTYPGRPE